jgi:hypothetical protein
MPFERPGRNEGKGVHALVLRRRKCCHTRDVLAQHRQHVCWSRAQNVEAQYGVIVFGNHKVWVERGVREATHDAVMAHALALDVEHSHGLLARDDAHEP